MDRLLSRRAVAGLCAGLALAGLPWPAAAQGDAAGYGFPIGLPDRVPGNGFVVRHGYATENTWYNPGWWHTGEDWYAVEGDTAGAAVVAVADGEVVFAGSEYPGLVVILRHADGLFSMYGHLDHALLVAAGDPVRRGDLVGAVLARTDGRAPSHLHFEIRTFLTTPEVNGAAPRYDVGCGYECPPGPGYWPIDAPEHPSALGWRNPTHVIGNRLALPAGAEAVVAATAAAETDLWSAPEGDDGAEPTGILHLVAGARFPLLDVAAGPADSTGTGSEAYRLWFRIAPAGGGAAWVRAAVPSDLETGSDGRPSAVRFDFLPESGSAALPEPGPEGPG